MPKQTFFNLLPEKQQLILDAIRKELTSVPYDESSINRIIKRAGISRGSFYQYFEDKEDMVAYVMSECKNEIYNFISEQLIKNDGDIFEVVRIGFERIVEILDSNDIDEKIKVLFFNPKVIASMTNMTCEHAGLKYEKTLRSISKMIDMPQLSLKTEKERVLLIRILASIVKDYVPTVIITKKEQRSAVLDNAIEQLYLLREHFSNRTSS